MVFLIKVIISGNSSLCHNVDLDSSSTIKYSAKVEKYIHETPNEPATK